MDISIFLAKFWGLYFVVLALIYLFRGKALKTLLGEISDKGVMLIFGFISLMIGLVMVLIHNFWVADWRVVITIFGWLALLKGVMLIGWPESAKAWKDKVLGKNLWIYFVILLIVGGLLIYVSRV